MLGFEESEKNRFCTESVTWLLSTSTDGCCSPTSFKFLFCFNTMTFPHMHRLLPNIPWVTWLRGQSLATLRRRGMGGGSGKPTWLVHSLLAFSRPTLVQELNKKRDPSTTPSTIHITRRWPTPCPRAINQASIAGVVPSMLAGQQQKSTVVGWMTCCRGAHVLTLYQNGCSANKMKYCENRLPSMYIPRSPTPSDPPQH